MDYVEAQEMELLVCIANVKEGQKFMKLAQEKGAAGATLFLGEGTVEKGFLKALGLDSVKKELMMTVVPKQNAIVMLDYIAEKRALHKKNRGIAFRMPLKQLFGVSTEQGQYRKEEEVMHQSIVVIVNRGEAEDVMEAAQQAGAKGGTIILGRGAGEYETKKVFNMEIEPEKEIILIISETSQTQAIVERVNEELGLEKPNTGILFVTDLSDTRGIH